jgi:hypothetical protein
MLSTRLHALHSIPRLPLFVLLDSLLLPPLLLVPYTPPPALQMWLKAAAEKKAREAAQKGN